MSGLKVRRLIVGPLWTNCYLVNCGGELLIVDPGAEAGRIIQEVKQTGLEASLIVITHGHPDHCSAYKEVNDILNSSVAIHRADLEVAEAMGISIKPDLYIEDGSRFRVGKVEFKVLHTPGHSPGSISLLGLDSLFTGDTMFRMGYGRTDLPGGSYTELVSSLRRILSLDEELIVYPGHGAATSIGDERRFYRSLGLI